MLYNFLLGGSESQYKAWKGSQRWDRLAYILSELGTYLNTTSDNSDSIEPTTIRITKQDVDPTNEKGGKAKYIKLGVYKRKWNWIEGLLEIEHKTDSRLVTFICTVKQVKHIVGYHNYIGLGDICFLMWAQYSG